jgi:symplekin
MAGRIESHIVRLQQMRKDILEGSGLKRPAEEPVDVVDQAKRQRIQIQPPQPVGLPPLPAHRPISLAELFTLTDDQKALSMNVKAIPPVMAGQVLVNLLRNHVSREALHHAANTVRSRHQQVTAPSLPIQTTTPLDDEDDYEPDYFPAGDAEQTKMRLDDDIDDIRLARPAPESVAVYRLPKPPPMMPAQLDVISYAITDRMFDNLKRLAAAKAPHDNKRGFQDAIVHGSMDVNAYFRMIIRLAIRPFSSTEDGNAMKSRFNGGPEQTPLSDYIRGELLKFIISDWQRKIGFAVTWLTEEYVAEKFKDYASTSNGSETDGAVKPISLPNTSNYKRWILRFLSDMSVYLGSGKQDLKFLVRFVSEIPLLDEDILKKVAQYADDPERVSTVSAAIRYLVMYRPSVKEAALDALETVWTCEFICSYRACRRILTCEQMRVTSRRARMRRC